MADQTGRNTSVESASPDALLEMASASWTTQALYVAARLDIAELLANGPMSGGELAQATGAHARSLFRLMRALVSLGICAQNSDDRFVLTGLGGYLRRGVPGSVHGMVLHWGGQLWETWSHLFDSVMTGKTARSLLHGEGAFETFAKHPEQAAVFNQAMVDITERAAQGVLRSYDFSSMRRVVDVGGGYGALLAAILRANSALCGVLLDLPHAIAGAKRYLEERGVLERCELVEGSFFDSVPGPADACLLKSVIHDWPDEQSAAILENCRKAVAPTAGKVLLVERIVPPRIEPLPAHQGIVRGDLNMMVAAGGCERTQEEFDTLLGRAGLRRARIIPTDSGFDVIEASLFSA